MLIASPLPPWPALSACLRMLAPMLISAGDDRPRLPRDAAAQEPAVLQAGDVTIRASAVPTTVLGEAAATQYGIERDPRTVLLLVGVRRGPDRRKPRCPRGSAAGGRPARQAPAARAARDPQRRLLDYAGTVRISPPETLRFDLVIERDGAAPATLSFNRDFFP